jgi:hypothetical protein
VESTEARIAEGRIGEGELPSNSRVPTGRDKQPRPEGMTELCSTAGGPERDAAAQGTASADPGSSVSAVGIQTPLGEEVATLDIGVWGRLTVSPIGAARSIGRRGAGG